MVGTSGDGDEPGPRCPAGRDRGRHRGGDQLVVLAAGPEATERPPAPGVHLPVTCNFEATKPLIRSPNTEARPARGQENSRERSKRRSRSLTREGERVGLARGDGDHLARHLRVAAVEWAGNGEHGRWGGELGRGHHNSQVEWRHRVTASGGRRAASWVKGCRGGRNPGKKERR